LVPLLFVVAGGLVVARGLPLARTLARGRAILGRLIPPFADTLRELLDLATVSSAVVAIGVDRA